MKELILENINLTLSKESGGVRVKSNTDNVILINQSVDNIANIIKLNFNVVNGFYNSRIANKPIETVELADINQISITIVLRYLYMYNSWRTIYKNKANQDLRFDTEDFGNPSTSDIIFSFYRKKYPNNWETPSSILLGITREELKKYYNEREKFYNK
ncbi:MAG TPA: hypothetical protein VNX40_13740 [Mucilaginibacter sp.]|jgi:hypothetical protein|nr:hypothetical protein [Mucilaginibacter sp.]